MNKHLCNLLTLSVLGLLAVLPVAAASFVKNPSFESNYEVVFPHLSTVDEWLGGSGVNESSGPFHNTGTPIPDQRRVEFGQGGVALSQDIVGLTPGKQYWLQFFYDLRTTGGTVDLVTTFNGIELDRVVRVTSSLGGAPYKFRNVLFTPDVDSGRLTFRNAVSGGDVAITLDAVTIVQRDALQTNNIGDLPVMNPSFEASGVVADPGLIAPDNIGGWTGAGQYGVASPGTTNADNGAVPDQDNVAFILGAGALSQVVPNLVAGSNYTVTVAYNAKSGTQPHFQLKVGSAVLFEEDVTPVGGTNPYRTNSVNFTATDVQATLTLAQTNAGSDVLLLDDVRVVGKFAEAIPPLEANPTRVQLAPGLKETIRLTVPTQVLAVRAVDIKLRSSDNNVATLVGAGADGILTVHYDQGGTNTKPFEVEGVGRGTVLIEYVETDGNTFVTNVVVDVLTSFVRNSSFETTAAPIGVGYGAILAWNGGSGLNTVAGPFQDNGVIPDRAQVAFKQFSGILSQQIVGLIAGQNYWLQFYYNLRNIAGASDDLLVTFAGNEIASIDGIAPVGGTNAYNFANVEFTPDSSTGLLEFLCFATGDATLLLDGVNIVQRDPGQIVVQNPSFEGSGSPPSGVGYVNPSKLAGWDVTGPHGINITGIGPFANNGSSPDQDHVLFLQGTRSASQNITGLTAGQKYTVIYAVNSRITSGSNLPYGVFFEGQPLLQEEITAVGGTEPYWWRAVVFTPTNSEGVLRFSSTPVAGTDRALLLDDIRIVPGVVEPPAPKPKVRIQAALTAQGNLRISWSTNVTGFVLQSTANLPGGWANDNSPVTVEGSENVVTPVTTGATAKYYRLAK